MRVKVALLRNALAGGATHISSTLYRLIQVPIFLSALGVEEYGHWLVLTSFPSLLMLANLGFGSVAANDMSMDSAAGNNERARVVFSTSLALMVLISLAGSAIILGVAPFIPWESFIGVDKSRHAELTTTINLFAIGVLASFSYEVFGGRFRCARKTHIAMVLMGVRPWLELLSIVLVLQYSTRFDHISMAILASSLLYLLLYQLLSWRAMPTMVFSFSAILPEQFRRLFRKGFSFQALGVGNAILAQGNLLVVQAVLGPAAVVLFGTARTLVGSVIQAMGMVNQITLSEFSYLMGKGDLVRAARLHHIGSMISYTMALLGTIFLATAGQSLYSLWTGSVIEIPQHLLLLFLLPVPFTAVYACSCTIHAACNQLEGLAVRYLLGTALSLVACYILSSYFGIEGAAISIVFVNLVSMHYVLKHALRLTGDTWSGFLRGLAREAFAALRCIKVF